MRQAQRGRLVRTLANSSVRVQHRMQSEPVPLLSPHRRTIRGKVNGVRLAAEKLMKAAMLDDSTLVSRLHDVRAHAVARISMVQRPGRRARWAV